MLRAPRRQASLLSSATRSSLRGAGSHCPPSTRIQPLGADAFVAAVRPYPTSAQSIASRHWCAKMGKLLQRVQYSMANLHTWAASLSLDRSIRCYNRLRTHACFPQDTNWPRRLRLTPLRAAKLINQAPTGAPCQGGGDGCGHELRDHPL